MPRLRGQVKAEGGGRRFISYPGELFEIISADGWMSCQIWGLSFDSSLAIHIH